MKGLLRTLLEGSTIVSLVACHAVTSDPDPETPDNVGESAVSQTIDESDEPRGGRQDSDVRQTVIAPILVIGRFDDPTGASPVFFRTKSVEKPPAHVRGLTGW